MTDTIEREARELPELPDPTFTHDALGGLYTPLAVKAIQCAAYDAALRKREQPKPAEGDMARALESFTAYFVKNYPGDRGGTIICDPKWHAPRIFRAALAAYTAGQVTDGDRRNAERLAFCCELGVFSVRDQGGDQWVMFAAVKSNRRSLFIGDTPREAIDAAIASRGAGEAASAQMSS